MIHWFVDDLIWLFYYAAAARIYCRFSYAFTLFCSLAADKLTKKGFQRTVGSLRRNLKLFRYSIVCNLL